MNGKELCPACLRPLDDTPLIRAERMELNAYRAKAYRESDTYYQQRMRQMINYAPPMSADEMQMDKNVNMHASLFADMNTQPSPSCVDEVAIETPGNDLTKLILRQAAYFLLLMLVVGVGLAVVL
jgi:hypothetical protein